LKERRPRPLLCAPKAALCETNSPHGATSSSRG
jgi:hypothetical protein